MPDLDAVITARAEHFGHGDRHGGWVFAVDVACCVEPGLGEGRPPANTGNAVTSYSGKVSARTFAERAGVSHPTVMRYLRAWERAAGALLVPPAANLRPDSDPPLPPADRWAEFYTHNSGPAPEPGPPDREPFRPQPEPPDDAERRARAREALAAIDTGGGPPVVQGNENVKLVMSVSPCVVCFDQDAVFEVAVPGRCAALVCGEHVARLRGDRVPLRPWASAVPLPTADEVAVYVEAQEFRRAQENYRGRPQAPHEYILLERCTDPWMQLRCLAFWREHGEARRWYSSWHHYWVHGEYEYWAMPPRETIINRRHLSWPTHV
jgi:hypothetical protein